MSLRIVCIFLLLNFWSFSAQEFNPDIVNTWYLISIEQDLQPTIYTEDVSPSISPFMVINPDLSFSGFGACNIFTGWFTEGLDLPDGSIYVTAFNPDNNNCESESQNTYEDAYFFQLDLPDGIVYNYQVTISDPESSFFILNPAPGYYLNFRLAALNTQEQTKNALTLYPNPTDDSFKIKGEIPQDASISITSISGVTQHLSKSQYQGYSIGHLPSGVYIITIQTPKQKQQLRLVKL